MSASVAVIGLMLVQVAAVADEPSSDSGGTSPRVVVEKKGQTARVVTEREVSVLVKIAPKATKNCQATMNTSSEQRDTIARVEGTIETADCAACSGDYTIVVRVRDESGETKTLEFLGSWQRADDQPVKFKTDYPIGENVDLLGVRSKGLHCVCADAPGGSAGDAAQGKE
jgi:hypothetical protein